MPIHSFPEMEQAIAAYWKTHDIFKRSVDNRPVEKSFSFFDGPPFATGLPHYGHIVASTIKDVIPRYATMRGFRVERRWGWDCHGLPVENLIEKELGLKSKQDIEQMGVAKFNDACRTSVLKYTNEWKQTIERLGRFVDMEHDYRTMDPGYMESVWWVFKQLYDQGLIYEGKKAMHVCPRCVTPLSNFEVTLGYKDIQDLSAYVKFKVKGEEYSLLAWTTTPWTLPGNLLLAVHPEADYVVVNTDQGKLVVAEKLVTQIFPGITEVEEKMTGYSLVNKEYEPLFPYFRETPDAFHVEPADFVSMTEGTGIVHIAPGYGENDYLLGVSAGVDMIQHVNMEGKFTAAVTGFTGASAKSSDQKIVAWLQEHGKLFKVEPIVHSYPHCWRCDTPLLNYATSSWFVRVEKLKADMLRNNDQVTWMPEHVKQGRFGKWLEGAKDWAISRERYWGAPLPVWKATDGEVICVGSRAELERLSGVPLTDVHKEFVDTVTFERNGKTFTRVSSVLDCWFESGAMPYAQNHWLGGEHAEQFPPGFPADFIAEGLDQTRGWFYTLMVLSTALYNKPAFQHVIVNGLVLAEDGKKMSKRLKNYPEPSVVMDKYGADALRFYLMSSPVVKAEDLRFSEKGVDLVMKRVIMTFWNVHTFYTMFAEGQTVATAPSASHVLDQWMLAYLQSMIQKVSAAMERYDLAEATRLLEQLIQETSTWYLRRSRDRFKSTNPTTKQAALATLRYVLLETTKLLAPFTPFIAERVYLNISQTETTGDSVHLQSWPVVQTEFSHDQVVQTMTQVRTYVEQVLALRETAGIKVRQPLPAVTLPQALDAQYAQILMDEVNVKTVITGQQLLLDTAISPQLAEEGMLRELVRTINALRKQKKFTIQDQVTITVQTADQLVSTVLQKYHEQLLQSVLAKSCTTSTTAQADALTVNGAAVTITLTK